MSGDSEPASPVDVPEEVDQLTVNGPVAPVDPGSGGQADRGVVAVAGGGFLTIDDEQVGSGEEAPDPRGAGRVVLGGDDEVQSGVSGGIGYLGRRPPPIGVHRVQVQVTSVPRWPATRCTRWRGPRYEDGPVRAEPEGDRHRPVQPLRQDLVWPQCDVPGSGADRTGQVPGRGIRGADGEGVPETAGPAAEPYLPARPVTALVEHPDVQ